MPAEVSTHTPDKPAAPPPEPMVDILAADGADLVAPPSDDDTEAEAKAAKTGWKPKDKFKGDPSAWRDAKTYLQEQEAVMPHLRHANRTLETKLTAAEKELARKEARLAALEAESADRKAREATYTEESLKAQRRQAVEAGDHDRVSEIDTQLIDIAVAKKAAPAPKPDNTAEQTRAQEIWNAFIEDNEAFKDKKMQRELVIRAQMLKADDPNLAGRELLDSAQDELKSLYPHLFTKTEPRRPNAMAESGGNNGHSRPNGQRGWNDLKPEVRDALERHSLDTSAKPEQIAAQKAAILKNCAENPTEYFRR